jgi:hypothetical protein
MGRARLSSSSVLAGAGRESRRAGRESAARVAALRQNDYTEYLRLAQHTKDARLRTLLAKTDAIIEELGLKARVHQGQTAPQGMTESMTAG